MNQSSLKVAARLAKKGYHSVSFQVMHMISMICPCYV